MPVSQIFDNQIILPKTLWIRNIMKEMYLKQSTFFSSVIDFHGELTLCNVVNLCTHKPATSLQQYYLYSVHKFPGTVLTLKKA